MRTHVACSGTLDLPLSADEAFPLFTPEGERRWVEGWSPRYPAAEAPQTAAGLAFVVGKEEGASTWLVTRFEPDARRATYAYVLPGHRATLVDVAVEPTGSAASAATVTYRMTSLAPGGDAFVREFGEDFEPFLEGWGKAIRRHIVEGEPLPTAPR